MKRSTMRLAVLPFVALTMGGILLSSPEISAKKVVIRVHHFETPLRGVDKLFLQYAKDYEKLNPNVQVKIEYTDYLDPFVQKVIAQVVAGVGPDIITGNNFSFPRHEKILMDLTPFLKRSKLSLDDFVPASRDAFMVGKKLLMIPYTAGAEAMFTNPKLLAEKGLPTPGDNWNLTDFRQYCTKLTTKSGNKTTTSGATVWGILNESVWWLWAYGANILNAGEDKFVLNSPETKRALDEYSDLMAKSLINGASFPNGTVGFNTGGPWMIKQFHQKFTMDVVPMPTGPIGKKITSAFINGWGIPSSSKNKAEAWKFIEFILNKENQVAQSPYEPPALIAAVKDNRSVQTQLMKNYRVFLDALEYGRNFRVSRQSDRVIATVGPEIDAVVAGKKSFEQAMNNVEKSVNAIIKGMK